MSATQMDHPEINDNRNYDYSNHPQVNRDEYSVIADIVKPNSRVIDLGCGNGVLLDLLKTQNNVADTGIEISTSGVEQCKTKGLNVIAGSIDARLPFNDNSFDYAICNVTIQMIMYPENLLKEMKRISRFQIISFPNFAFWKNRIELLLQGRMPRKMLFGYSWYSTGHIHQLSFKDFEQLVKEVGGLKIVTRQFVPQNKLIRNMVANIFPNLFHMIGIYLLEKE